MTKTIDLYVTLIVPENILALYCSRFANRLNSDFDPSDFVEDIEDIEGSYVVDPTPYMDARGKYKLDQFDKPRLDYLINMIKSATDAQLKPDSKQGGHDKNSDFKQLLEQFNKTNTAGYHYTIADIVRLIGDSNYKQSWIDKNLSNKSANQQTTNLTAYNGWEFHEFTDIVLPGFTTNAKTHIYIKVAAPMRRNPAEFSVVAVHHNAAKP